MLGVVDKKVYIKYVLENRHRKFVVDIFMFCFGLLVNVLVCTALSVLCAKIRIFYRARVLAYSIGTGVSITPPHKMCARLQIPLKAPALIDLRQFRVV